MNPNLFKRRIAMLGVAAALAACSGSGDGGGASADAVAPVVKAETPTDASRFLSQATFGPTAAEVDRVLSLQLEQWLEDQFAKPIADTHLAYWEARKAETPSSNSADWLTNSFWRGALTGDDALRQRVAFALSQIFVVSLVDANVARTPRGVASYYDMLGRHAFGNFRNLLEDVTLHPMMGVYLSHLKNRGDGSRVPDENYAREVMQLFTIGLYALDANGTVRTGADGRPIEAYGNDDVTGIAKVFTGWGWAGPDRSDARFTGGGSPVFADRDITPMQAYPQFHHDGPKTFLGITCPGGVMPPQSLKCGLDGLFAHPNTGPFIARQLIQRLVTSNPSPGYVGRVAARFADNGAGVRGDMKAVLRAILLDPEARIAPAADALGVGKVREPILRATALMRATGARSASGQFRIGATDDPTRSLGQTVMRSPSVFNFWRPGYTPANSDLALAGLVAPELQASNEMSVAGYLNAMQTLIQSGIGSGSPRDLQLDLDDLAAIAADGDALLARIELLVLSRAFDAPSRQRIREVIESVKIPATGTATAVATARRNRVMAALYLSVASPEFLAQK
ncbi:MAG: DUF1800 family protein [Lautropia sp.]